MAENTAPKEPVEPSDPEKVEKEGTKRINIVVGKDDYKKWNEWAKKVSSGNLTKFIKLSVDEKIDAELGYEYQVGDEFKFLSDEKQNAMNFFSHGRLEMMTEGVSPKNFIFFLKRDIEDDRVEGIRYTIVVMDVTGEEYDEDIYYELSRVPLTSLVQISWLESFEGTPIGNKDLIDQLIAETWEGVENSLPPSLKVRGEKGMWMVKKIKERIVAHLEFRMTQNEIKISDNFNTDPSYYYRDHPDNLQPEPPIEIPEKYRMKVQQGELPESFPISNEEVSFPITVYQTWNRHYDGIAETMLSLALNVGKTKDIYKYSITLTQPATMAEEEFKEYSMLFYNMMPPQVIQDGSATFYIDERSDGEIEKRKLPRMRIVGK